MAPTGRFLRAGLALPRATRRLALVVLTGLTGAVCLLPAISSDVRGGHRATTLRGELDRILRDARTIARLRAAQQRAAARPTLRKELVALFETTAHNVGMAPGTLSLEVARHLSQHEQTPFDIHSL